MGGHARSEKKSRLLRRWFAGLGALIVGGMAVIPSASADVEPGGINKPPLTGTIISFPQRDFISAEGWGTYAAVDVEVWRPNPALAGDFILVGIARDVDPDAAGLVEVNHPGGACWGPVTPGDASTAVTPDIKAGDRIRLSAKNAVGGVVQVMDQTTTANVTITQFVSAISANTVELRGRALQEDGVTPIPLAELEVRLIGSSKDRFSINNRRDLRAPRDGNLAIDAAGNWVATIPGLSAADMARALAAENRVVWLGSNPAAGTEATIFEAGDAVAPGPQAPCTAPLQGAIAAANRASIDFPATTVATTSAPETVRIANAGAGALADLVVDAVTITGVDAPSFSVVTPDGCTGNPRPVGATCDIQLTFTPVSTGLKSAVLNIHSNAGNTLLPITATGLGTGVGEEIAFGLPTPGAMGFGTRSEGNTSPAQTLTIKNIGNIPMVITGTSIVGTHAGDFLVTGGTCVGGTVNAGATCTYTLTFTPFGEGDRTASLRITSNADPVVVELTGGGLITTGLIDPPPPPISLGVFVARDFVSVEGFDPGELLTLQIIRHGVVVGVATDTVVGEDGIAEVNHPGGDCWDAVTPNIRAGDILRVTRNADGRAYQTTTADVKITQHAQETFPGSNIVEFKGYARDLVTGAPLPLEQLETRMIATSADPFGLNGRRAVNSGTDGVLVYDTVANPDGTKWTSTYDFNQSPTPAHDVQLAIDNENRMLWLGRDPLALFEITFWEDGDAVADGPSAPCTAPAEAPSPGITVSPALHTFPQLTSSETADRTFTVRNIGTAPLDVSSVTFGGANPGDFRLQGGLPGGTIAPGATGSFQVRFQPTGIGPRSATVLVGDNAVGSPHTALVTGTGVLTSTASVLVAPTALTFPDTQVGVDSAALSVTVTNEGGAPLTLSSMPTIAGLNAADFRRDDTAGTACNLGTSLGTGATCTVSVIFNPGAVNGRAATLSIATNDPSTPTTVVPLTGSASTTGDGVFDPPRAPHVIEAFPVRDYVAATGYALGEFVRIDIYRGGLLVGSSQVIAPVDIDPAPGNFVGFVEINHVGGGCWAGLGAASFTPDILPGDVVRAVVLNGANVQIGADQIHVADLSVSVPATQTGAGTVIMTGSAIDPFTGAPLPLGSIEPRITSTTGLFEGNGRRDIRAGSGLDGTVTMVGNRWTATFTGLSANDVATAVSGDSKVVWLGRNPLALNELTHWEWNEIPGPDVALCPTSPLTVSDPTLNTPALSFSYGGLGAASAVQSVFFANPAGGPTAVTPVIAGFEGPNGGDFAVAPTSTCGAALAPGQSCRIDVVFTASALGLRLGSLKITHDGANNVSFLPVSGIGVAPPTVTLVNPASVGHGGTVTVSGTNLTSTTGVTIGGLAATFTVVSDAQVQAIVPALAAPGAGVVVSITTVAGNATGTMTVLPDAPTITTVTPASGKVGDAVTITGTNLAGATVTFNGVAAAATVNGAGTSLTTSVPAGATTGTLRVITAGGAATAAFTVIPAPTVSGFTPTSAKTGSVITINGANFTNTATVTFSTTGAPVAAAATFVSATQLRVTVPGAAVQGPVTVTSGGQSGSAVFTVERAPSNITLAPATGPIGTTVTISGFNFLQTSKVSFNGKNATFAIVNERTITATVPAGTTTGVVSVGNKWGSTNGPTFTIITAPTITSFTPATATKGVSTVTVTGTGFGTATAVALGQGATSVNVPGFTIVNATTIRFTVPITTTNGLYTVRISNPAGTGSSVAVLTVIG